VKLLAYTSPSRGHLYPLLGILAELVSRGDNCVACTLSDELGHVRALGATGLAIEPRVERIELEDWRARSPRSAIRSALETFGERAALEGPDLERALAAHDPDVVLVDVNCWGAAAAAEACGRPWAMYSPYLLPLPSPGLPPYGPGLPPRRGPAGRARDALVRRLVAGTFEHTALTGVNAARARSGLAQLACFGDFLTRAPLLLYLTAEGFEYPRRAWPANVRLVGAVEWAAPPAVGGTVDLNCLPDPLVLVTCSTERQADRRLVDVALAALPPAGFSVVATTAAHDPREFAAPAGTQVTRFVPHDVVLPRATCVVCHGGMGITQRALAAGVPVVVVPFGRDQLETGRRVDVAGAGVCLAPGRLSGPRLLGAVLSATERRDGAARVSRAYLAAGGARAAADAIRAHSDDRGAGSGSRAARSPART
jgi:UDP:flavonoid glycosyltransferase YjiC (YdhE family)